MRYGMRLVPSTSRPTLTVWSFSRCAIPVLILSLRSSHHICTANAAEDYISFHGWLRLVSRE